MPDRKDIRKRMADLHEAHIAELFGTEVNRGSGNQWNRQMDARNDSHVMPFAFAFDGKATLAKSISVSRDMWSKAFWQSGWERTGIPLRFYDGERLTQCLDLVVVSLNDLHEMWVAANGRTS